MTAIESIQQSQFHLFDLRSRRSAAQIRHRLAAFFERLREPRASGPYDAVMREVERPLIAGALARARGVRATAAEALGIDRGTLARRIRALGIDEDGT